MHPHIRNKLRVADRVSELGYSQNFIRSTQLIEELISASSITPSDHVIEVGPGKGRITRVLAGYARVVTAFEKDPELYARLKETIPSNVELIHVDFLRMRLPDTPYKVFSNIPFNITADIIRKLITAKTPPLDIYLIIQREAALKFSGTPLASETLASLLIKPWFIVEILYNFRRTDFEPVPGVDIVLLRLEERQKELINMDRSQAYRDFIAYNFTSWTPDVGTSMERIVGHGRITRIERDIHTDLSRKPSSMSFMEWLKIFWWFDRYAGPDERAVIEDSERKLKAQQAGLQKIHRTRASPQ